ncbi:Uncharacterized protein SCF082_LOCUS25983, partial [Durusdinium trenchii]
VWDRQGIQDTGAAHRSLIRMAALLSPSTYSLWAVPDAGDGDFVLRTKNTFLDVVFEGDAGETMTEVEPSPLARSASMPDLTSRLQLSTVEIHTGHDVTTHEPMHEAKKSTDVTNFEPKELDKSPHMEEDECSTSPSEPEVSPVSSMEPIHQNPTILEAHRNGTCVPCLFYTRKSDGCRMGDLCTHCHYCSATEARRKRNVQQSEKRKRERRHPVNGAYRRR